MNAATIFYNDEQMLAGGDKPFDVRFDAAILPRGSVVVGFMKWDGKEIVELIDEPYMAPNQEQNWKNTLSEARAVLRGEPVAE